MNRIPTNTHELWYHLFMSILKERGTMEIILHQKITMLAPRLDYKNVYKKIESEAIPREGDHIRDIVFTDETKILVKTVIKDKEKKYNVYLEDFEILHAGHLIIEEIVKKYILHGWTTVDE